jgi:hypothetical protein
LYYLLMPEHMGVPESIDTLYERTLKEGFAVKQHAFPPGLVTKLQEYVARLPERKTELGLQDIAQNIALLHIREMLTKKIAIPGSPEPLLVCPNVAIIKHYQNGDKSSAYEFHKDPEKYKGIFSIVTLSGETTLEIADTPQGTVSIKCTPNTLVTMLANNGHKFVNEHPIHKISEPAPGQRRDMIFLGMTAETGE